ncbi:MAG TPA: signal peptidase I [Spirochaetia bacterium]|nr:signal peptidase I [Spirochaetia bacterium]
MFGSRAREYTSYRERNTFHSSLFRFIRFLVLLVVCYLFVTHFLVNSRTIDSVSMEPTLLPGDRIITTSLSYGPTVPLSSNHFPGLAKPARGDLVVIATPYYRRPPILLRIVDPVVRFFTLQRVTVLHAANPWEQPYLVRRIIGVPGDTVKMKDYSFFVRPQGESSFVPELQLASGGYEVGRKGLPAGWNDDLPFSGTLPETTLGKNDYFVAGDNRVESTDSRYFGPVPTSAIREKVILRYFPFRRFVVLK